MNKTFEINTISKVIIWLQKLVYVDLLHMSIIFNFYSFMQQEITGQSTGIHIYRKTYRIQEITHISIDMLNKNTPGVKSKAISEAPFTFD